MLPQRLSSPTEDELELVKINFTAVEENLQERAVSDGRALMVKAEIAYWQVLACKGNSSKLGEFSGVFSRTARYYAHAINVFKTLEATDIYSTVVMDQAYCMLRYLLCIERSAATFFDQFLNDLRALYQLSITYKIEITKQYATLCDQIVILYLRYDADLKNQAELAQAIKICEAAALLSDTHAVSIECSRARPVFEKNSIVLDYKSLNPLRVSHLIDILCHCLDCLIGIDDTSFADLLLPLNTIDEIFNSYSDQLDNAIVSEINKKIQSFSFIRQFSMYKPTLFSPEASNSSVATLMQEDNVEMKMSHY
jgi:hypothetical protein